VADENGYNWELTVHFSDTDSITEYFVREESVDRAMRSWYYTQEADALIGEHYEITGFDKKEL
jgi:hypothetical protein